MNKFVLRNMAKTVRRLGTRYKNNTLLDLVCTGNFSVLDEKGNKLNGSLEVSGLMGQ